MQSSAKSMFSKILSFCLFIFIVVPLYGQSLPSIDELRQLETKARGKNISLENFEDLINKVIKTMNINIKRVITINSNVIF